jgi:apolipoprotein N-acyltransferase
MTAPPRWPGWRVCGAAFGLGAVAATGQAPWGMWFLALPAFAAIFVLVGRSGALAALFAGAGHFGLALSWIVEPFFVEPETHGWMAPFAVTGLAFGLALFWMAGLGLGRRFGAVGMALGLTLAEIARGVVLTGFPWALPGHVWIGTPVDQVAALAGANGLTLLTLAAAALPLAAPRAGTAAAAAILAAAAGFGLWRLDRPLPDRTVPVTVRLVQPNADQHLKWDADAAHRFFARALDLTRDGTAVDVAIWPETSMPYLLDEALGAVADIGRAGRGAPVMVGVQRSDGGGWRVWNALAVIGPDGRVQAVYDKHHLVPFGEYIPFGDLMFRLFGITAFAAQTGAGYSAGAGPAVIDLGPRLGRIAPLICYEAVFPAILRAMPERADWIVQVTNDAWFGTRTGPFQHFALARLRAVEQGLPLARSANTGITAMVDARGRVTAALPMGAPGALDTSLPAALPPTPYARWGEAPVWLLLAGVAAALALRRRLDAPRPPA